MSEKLIILLVLILISAPIKPVLAQSATPNLSPTTSDSPTGNPTEVPTGLPTIQPTGVISPSPSPPIVSPTIMPQPSPSISPQESPIPTTEAETTGTPQPSPTENNGQQGPTETAAPTSVPSNTPTPSPKSLIPIGPPDTGGTIGEVVGKVGNTVITAPLRFINTRVAQEVYRTESLSAKTENRLTAAAAVLMSLGLALIRPGIINKAGLKINGVIEQGSKAELFKTISRLL